MAEKKYYSIDEAAGVLGITPAEVNLRRERNELHGYRDGANWKFKAEDVEALARRIRTQELAAAGDEDDTGEVLLSEVALGGSDAGTSGTVIGGEGKAAADSDLRLADSEIKLGGSDVKPSGSGTKKSDSGTKKAGGSALDLVPGAKKKKPLPSAQDLELTIDEGLLLDEELPLGDELKPGSGSGKKPGSAVGKKPGSGVAKKPGSGVGKKAGDSGTGLKLEDDELVIGAGGGGGTGSDVTIGSDSGISLVDPTDSGLSLEEPLELEREEEEESLELGEDDMLTFSEEAEAEADAPTALKADEGFQLTPLEEAGEEDSESGSQVIALEGAPVSDAAPTMIATGGAPMAAAMLDEDFTGGGAPLGLGAAMPAAGSPLGMAQPMFTEQGAMPAGGAPTMILPEVPYSGLQVTSLVVCTILLILCGWMGYDLLRNMWSWNGTYPVNSFFMEMILKMFG
jgi:hypothetical protein